MVVLRLTLGQRGAELAEMWSLAFGGHFPGPMVLATFRPLLPSLRHTSPPTHCDDTQMHHMPFLTAASHPQVSVTPFPSQLPSSLRTCHLPARASVAGSSSSLGFLPFSPLSLLLDEAPYTCMCFFVPPSGSQVGHATTTCPLPGGGQFLQTFPTPASPCSLWEQKHS